MNLLPEKITVTIEGRTVLVQAWVYEVEGISGHRVPVLFLDTNIETNASQDRELTAYLYGGDERYRLKQEVVLGLGGVRILQILDHDNLEAYHMNEGHAALLSLELMDRYQQNLERVRELCIFTTHTPVPAGHDTFDVQMVRDVLGGFIQPDKLNHNNIIDVHGRLNMTYLALHHAEYINGVAKKHGETAQKMFPEYRIDAITNGIYTRDWVPEAMAGVFDRYIPNWRNDPYTLRNALNIPRNEIWDAHQAAKHKLIDFIRQQHGMSLDPDIFTIGFARRSATYKRSTLVLHDPVRLQGIAAKVGRIQIIFAGKAHPKDGAGKDLIRSIFQSSRDFNEHVTILYLPNYDIYRAKLLVAGVDLWLNTPLRPMEASGTSGMKAAVNGVINFSVLDGWWIEGHIEDLTGWSIGPKQRVVKDDPETSRQIDVEDLYTKLENRILPLFYNDHERWKDMMAYNIALNGSFFNTHRMVSQYVMQAYFR
jgi:starch phosphorylase